MRRIAFLGLATMVSCGGATTTPSGSGGMPGAGGSESQGAGGAAIGGGAGVGGSAQSGGAASVGGNPSGGNGQCPIVPAARLLPWIGVFQYGPDPGPCSMTAMGQTETYGYEDSRVVTSTELEGTTFEYDGELRIAKIVHADGSGPETEAYAPDRFTETDGVYTVVYRLDERGYVTQAESDRESDGIVDGVWTYEYEDCRLVRRVAPEGAGEDRIYEYDEVGHISSFTEGTDTTTFDYSCWK